MHYIKVPVKGSTTNIATHNLTVKLPQIYVGLQSIDKHPEFFCAHITLKFTQTTFQCPDKRLKVFELLKTFCVFMGDTQSQLQQQRLDVIFHVKKKKGKDDIWADISLWKIVPCQLAEGGWDELQLESRCWLSSAAHSSLYLTSILLPHFNSHSSLKSPLRCCSHFLWFVF